MVVLNDLDRFHLVEDVIDRLPQLGARAAYFKQAIHEKLIEHKEYIGKHGDDMPAISGWKWGAKEPAKPTRHFHRRGKCRRAMSAAERTNSLVPPQRRWSATDVIPLCHGCSSRGTATRTGPIRDSDTGRTDLPLNERGEERARQTRRAVASIYFRPRFHQSLAARVEDVRAGRLRQRSRRSMRTWWSGTTAASRES